MKSFIFSSFSRFYDGIHGVYRDGMMANIPTSVAVDFQ
jgi:hypothetical protein